MQKKASFGKWLIFILIALVGIAFIFYRKATHAPTTIEQQIPQEHVTQSIDESYQEPDNKFFNYTEPEETQTTPEEKPIEVVKQKIKQPEKKQKKESKKEKAAPTEKTVEREKKEPKQVVVVKQFKDINLIIDMTKKSLAYKYLFIHYSPSKWELKLNDTMILTFDGKHLTQIKDTITIDPEKPILAHFDFEFLGGRRLGWKEVVYQIDKDADALHINFDWKDPKDDQILISPAKALSKNGHHNHDGAK